MTTKCECCGTLNDNDAYGTVCHDCGGRGVFVALNDAWNPEPYIVSELTKRGFIESSYRNDVCASYSKGSTINDEEYLQVFIDSEIPEDRECPDYPRFGVINENQDELIGTDNFSEVLALIDQMTKR